MTIAEKTAPRPGQLSITHITLDTGHVRSFAVHADNYKPDVIRRMRDMETKPVMGYRLTSVIRFGVEDIDFNVSREDGTPLTRNRVTRFQDRVELRTRILRGMPCGEAAMLADLEQCAALSLLGIVAGPAPVE